MKRRLKPFLSGDGEALPAPPSSEECELRGRDVCWSGPHTLELDNTGFEVQFQYGDLVHVPRHS